VGGVMNMMMMMTANLIGFVVGTDGFKFLASQLFGTWDGARFMVLAATCMFFGVQLMFEYRYVISPFRIYRLSVNILRY
jgi:D-alanyl-lipoteichoic acid acyltransferase DltB (MBOAT superfamily)